MFSADRRVARVLLLDIEGTTTPIDFVYKTLFPYASRRVEPFLREQHTDPEIAALIRGLQADNQRDHAAGLPAPAWSGDDLDARLRSTVSYVQWLISKDSKHTALKSLQGKIWQRGFASGELRGEVYADVPRAFARWRKQFREIYIYSSGSVLAQQQLFKTVISGDLTPYISGFFDTQSGIKTSTESYQTIAASIRSNPGECLFISDVATEVQAAQSAGMHALLCDRIARESSDQVLSEAIHTFDEVFPG